jgi:hypothetical protein
MATVHSPVEANDVSVTTTSLIVHVKGAPDRMLPVLLSSSQRRIYQKGKDLEPVEP